MSLVKKQNPNDRKSRRGVRPQISKISRPKISGGTSISNHPLFINHQALHKRLLSDAKGGWFNSNPSPDVQAQLEESNNVMMSMLDPQATYLFRLTGWSDLTPAATVIAQAINFDPSSSSEYSSLSAIFGTVRLHSCTLHITPNHASSVTTLMPPIFVGADGGKNSVTPASKNAVIECPISRIFPSLAVQTLSVQYKAYNMEWATVAAPVPGPYAGCYGQFSVYGDGFTIATAIFTFMVEKFVEFSSRS